MKILAQGIPAIDLARERAQTWRKQVRCSSCKSELEINADDIRYVPTMDGSFYIVDCPVCENRIDPFWWIFPGWIRLYVSSK